MVGHGGAPGLVCVVIIVAGAGFVGFAHLFQGFFFGDGIFPDDSFYPVFFGRVDKYAGAMRVVFQDIVRTTSYNHTGAFCGDFAYHI